MADPNRVTCVDCVACAIRAIRAACVASVACVRIVYEMRISVYQNGVLVLQMVVWVYERGLVSRCQWEV